MPSKDKSSKRSAAVNLLCAVFAAFAVIFVVYYINFPSFAEFHSDCTDTLYWAEASVSSGKLFNPDFNYAALLPFGGSLLMLPFVAIFGATSAAHTIGMVIFALLLLISIYFLFHRVGMSEPMCYLGVGVTALVLSCSVKLREIYWGHVIYYSLSVFFIFVLLSLTMRVIDKPNIRSSIGSLVALFIFAFLVGFDDLQLIAVSVFPVLFAIAGERFLDSKTKLFDSQNALPFTAFIGTAGSAFLGLLALKVTRGNVSAGYENAYSKYSAMDEWLDHILELPLQWLSLMGINIADHDEIFSAQSILSIVLMAFSIVIGVVPVIALFFYNHFSKKEKLLLLAHWGLTIAILFGYIFGFLAAANWRLSPIVCSCVVVCMMCVARAFKSKKLVAKRFAALALCVLLAASALSCYRISEMPKNGKAQNENYLIAKMLSDNNLEYGFATFWHSQSITVLSDQKVKTRCIDVSEDTGISARLYQSQRQWFEPQQGVDKYFILLSTSEIIALDRAGGFTELKDAATESLTFSNYLVLIYPMSEPMPW